MLLNCGAGEVPWTARKSNQSILKEINPECSLEGLMLKLQYFGHLMWRADSLEMTLMLGKTEGRRRRGQQRTRWLDGISGHEFEQTPGDSEGQGSLLCCSLWICKELDRTEWLNKKNSKEISHSFLLLEKEISTPISVSLTPHIYSHTGESSPHIVLIYHTSPHSSVTASL